MNRESTPVNAPDDASAVGLLTRLVAIPSFSGEEGEASRFLADAMGKIGFDQSGVDAAGNAFGIRGLPNPPGGSGLTIVLLGHIDTVTGWIEPRTEGDLFYGRGSVDAKGPLAAMTIAAARARLTPGTQLVVVGAVEEESASSRGARHVATRFHPDLCVIGEPSGWDGYTLGYKGRLLIDYRLEQNEGHWAGQRVSAGETAIGWWNQLEALAVRFNSSRPRLFDQLLLALRSFQTSGDGLQERVDLRAGLRLPPDFDQPALERQILAFSGPAQIRFHAHEPAWQSPRTSVLATAFSAAIRKKGNTPKQKLKTGTSDMNVVGPVWNCPIVAYGPGDSALDHAPNEHVGLGEFLKSIDVLQEVIETLPALASRSPHARET